MRQMVTLGLIGMAIGVVLVLTVGCGGESITNPNDVAVSQSGGAVSQTAVPAPAPTPTPSPEPVGSAPYVELNKNPKDGSGTLFNPKPHPVVFVLEYFDATNFWNQKLLKKIGIEVKPKSSYALKAWRPEECGIKITIQLDIAANVGHVGHVLYEVKTDECKCQKESVIESKTTYGEWSECKEGGDGCFSS